MTDRVSQDRWEAAQDWERNHWVNAQRARARFGKNYIWRLLALLALVPKHRGDDWNEWWRQAFDGYRFLPDWVTNAIEVGCGPYTNVRLIRETCRIDHLVLSDPLIRTYVGFRMTFVNEMYREAACTLDVPRIAALGQRLLRPRGHDQRVGSRLGRSTVHGYRNPESCGPGAGSYSAKTFADDKAALDADPGGVRHPINLDSEWFDPFLLGFNPK